MINTDYCELQQKVESTYKKKKFIGFEWWVKVKEKSFGYCTLFIAWQAKDLPDKVQINNQVYIKQNTNENN